MKASTGVRKSFSAQPVAGGVRMDITDDILGNDPKVLTPRFSSLLSIDEAKMYVIIMVEAIRKAEVLESTTKKGKRK